MIQGGNSKIKSTQKKTAFEDAQSFWRKPPANITESSFE